MEEQNQNSVNLEIPSRWRRFFAYILDLIINITIIWFIINIITILVKKTTLWAMILWIIAIDNENKWINFWKSLLRYFIFYSTLFFIAYILWFIVSYLFRLVPQLCSHEYPSDFCQFKRMVWKILNIIFVLFSIPYFINIIEIFFKCPTFIDKRLWIKRIYKKSKKNNE